MTEYWNEINLGNYYLCDRCNVSKLRADEFYENIQGEFRYCDECYNWTRLQVWTDNEGNTHTLRSERLVGKDIFP